MSTSTSVNPTPMVSHAVFLTHRSLPGRREEVQVVWQQHLQPAVKANPDHLGYHYCYDATDGDVIRVCQIYTNADAAAAFLRTSVYAAYVLAVEPLLAGPPDVANAREIWRQG